MFEHFRELSEEAQLILCMYAYAADGNTRSHDDFVKILKKHTKLSFGDEVMQQLQDSGFLQRKGYNWLSGGYMYGMSKLFFVPALLYTLYEKAKYVENFQKWGITSGTKLKNLRDVICRYVNSDHKEVTGAKNIPEAEAELLFKLFYNNRFYMLLTSLNERCFVKAFGYATSYMYEHDIAFDASDFYSLVGGARYVAESRKKELEAEVDLYNYVANGILANAKLSKTYPAHLILAAIHELLAGEYDASVKHFLSAFKLTNALADVKNAFPNILFNYFLILAYVHHGQESSRIKLSQFVNKQDVRSMLIYSPAYVIAATDLKILNEDVQLREIAELWNYGVKENLYTYWEFAYLLANYFGAQPEKFVVSIKPFKPSLLLVRHELSKFLDLTDEERAELQNLYGDKPALTSIYHKAKWEALLDALDSVDVSQSQKDAERSARVAYLLRPRTDYVEPREQTRLKSGEWGAGKSMSDSRFRYGDDTIFDDIDLRIRERLQKSYDYNLTLAHVIEDLEGTDRLLYGDYAPYQPVRITREYPYVTIDREEQTFVLGSNLALSDVESSALIIKKQNATSYSFIRLSPIEQATYKQLLSVTRFPLEAEERLRAVLPKLGGKVEVHSELVEGGSLLPQVKGVGVACVQIHPMKDGYYSINISSRPLPGGKHIFSLAKGKERYIDERSAVSTQGVGDGSDTIKYPTGRMWVERDMKAERQVKKCLKAFFAGLGEESEGVYEPDVLLDADSNPEVTPDFLLPLIEFIQQNPDKMYAEWPEGSKLRVRNAKKGLSWTGSLKSRGHWFEVEGEIDLDQDTVISMADLLELVAQSRGRFIRLGEGEYIALSDTLQRQLRALEAVSSRERGKLHISPFSAALLGEDAINGDIKLKLDKNLVELRKKILKSSEYAPKVPKELNATLRPYQVDGYQWMARLNSWGAGALLADDMGLGKTVQTIAFLLLKASEGASLVVAPASVAPNWFTEFQKFAPSLRCTILNFEQDRRKAIEEAGPGDVIITTYGILLSAQEDINSRSWNVVCLDEAHVIKNRGAKTSAAAMKIQADNRVMLTGTPVQNHLGELWSLFQFVNPGLLGGYEDFSRKYIVPIERDEDRERQEQLDRLVRPFMLRRTKNSVLRELPDKTEIYQSIELSKDELAIYEVIRQKAETMLQLSGGDKVDMNALAEITKLRQAACSPMLVEKKWKGTSSKVTALVELVGEVIDGGNRALVFSQFTSFLDIVRRELDKAGVKYLYIDGAVPVKTRTKLVNEFQEGKCPLFLISLKAGGLGLNLTGANYVFHLDPWWNPAIEQQATDRAYRIGQKQAVTVYHLIAQNTIEEKIIRLHQTKRDLAENILEGTDISHKLTGKDLLEMVAK